MRNLAGVRFGELTNNEKESLMRYANAVDATTGNTPKNTGECIIDLTSEYSAVGHYDVDSLEIKINDDAIIYNPCI